MPSTSARALEFGRWLVALLAVASLVSACGRGKPSPSASAPAAATPPGCTRVLVHPPGGAVTRWSVTLPLDHTVLSQHEARFDRLGITPNGPAWEGLLTQCLAKEGAPLPSDVDLDPEAGSLHAWATSERSKDRLVAVFCRAIDDEPWLDQCLGSIDRSSLDD
jgi:hypothetical protein